MTAKSIRPTLPLKSVDALTIWEHANAAYLAAKRVLEEKLWRSRNRRKRPNTTATKRRATSRARSI